MSLLHSRDRPEVDSPKFWKAFKIQIHLGILSVVPRTDFSPNPGFRQLKCMWILNAASWASLYCILTSVLSPSLFPSLQSCTVPTHYTAQDLFEIQIRIPHLQWFIFITQAREISSLPRAICSLAPNNLGSQPRECVLPPPASYSSYGLHSHLVNILQNSPDLSLLLRPLCGLLFPLILPLHAHVRVFHR